MESDSEFVERLNHEWQHDCVPCVEDWEQLITLARKGAEAPKGFTAGWLAGRDVPPHHAGEQE